MTNPVISNNELGRFLGLRGPRNEILQTDQSRSGRGSGKSGQQAAPPQTAQQFEPAPFLSLFDLIPGLKDFQDLRKPNNEPNSFEFLNQILADGIAAQQARNATQSAANAPAAPVQQSGSGATNPGGK